MIGRVRGMKRGEAVVLGIFAAFVVIVVGAAVTSGGGGPDASSNSSSNSSTTDTSVGGSSNDAWMQQCIDRRLANGNPQEQAKWGDGGRLVAEDLCSHGAHWDSVTSNLGVAGANQ